MESVLFHIHLPTLLFRAAHCAPTNPSGCINGRYTPTWRPFSAQELRYYFWSRMAISSSLNIQHGLSCLGLITVGPTPTASSVAASFQDRPDFLDCRALPSISLWQWWNDFRPEGFLDNSDERHRLRASRCWLRLSC